MPLCRAAHNDCMVLPLFRCCNPMHITSPKLRHNPTLVTFTTFVDIIHLHWFSEDIQPGIPGSKLAKKNSQ